jgi:sialate O-acetylesterase
VQLAPYPARYAPPDAWPLLREQQADSLKVPHTEMVVTTDAGEHKDIHPQDKRTPGERLAQVALSMEGIDKPVRSPLFERLVIRQDGRCEIYFTNAQSGLKTQRVAMNRRPDIAPGQDPHALVAEKEILQGFEIRGADGNWISARASIQSPGNGLPDYVEVWSPEVPDPVSVRYGWANFPLCNLYNREGQPASPFRSDR